MITKQTKITKSARGQDCTIRIPGICKVAPDNETTVLAHDNGEGGALRAPDYQGAYACYECHMAVDGHLKTDYPSNILRLWHLEGIMRTQRMLVEQGLLEVK